MAGKSKYGDITSPNSNGASGEMASFQEVLKQILMPLASLKLTVALFAMAIVLVLIGTLAQAKMGILQVVDNYFHAWVAWVKFEIFFPPAFFPNFQWKSSAGFWFPGGKLIGGLMAVNLLAAHGLRFKIQTRGTRLILGLAVMAFGVVMTWLVIASGMNNDGFQDDAWRNYSKIWKLFLSGLGLLWLATVYGAVMLAPEQKVARWFLIAKAVVLGGILVWLLSQGQAARLNDSSMRILWQLVKATAAALVMLAGCVLVFKKRAGIVLLHGGVGLMMLSEVLVGTSAVEARMMLGEGQSSNFTYDLRTCELAVIDVTDPENEFAVVIPRGRLIDPALIEHDELPFDIKVDQFMVNSKLRQTEPGDNNFADTSAGLQIIADKLEPVPGTEGSEIDMPSVYVVLFNKETDKPLGRYLMRIQLREQLVELGKKKYKVSLRLKRRYKPYTIKLLKAERENYDGTTIPRDYSSHIHLVDGQRGVNRDRIRIWMNNPLRYAGETFYQSSFENQGTAKRPVNVTTLQVVTNTGWMIPYVSCMIVATGLLAHFGITLLRFLNRLSREGSADRIALYLAPLAVTGIPVRFWAALLRFFHLQQRASADARRKTESDRKAAEIEDDQHVGPVFYRHEDRSKKKTSKDKKKQRQEQHRKKERSVRPSLSHAGEQSSTTDGPRIALWLMPLIFVGLGVMVLAYAAKPPRQPEDEVKLYEFGKLPCLNGGRIKPIDTLARNSLNILSKTQSFKDTNDRRQPAIRWLIDVVTGSEAAEKHKIFRIENLEVLEMLGLTRRKGFRYSLSEFSGKMDALREQVRLAIDMGEKKRGIYEQKILDLNGKVQRYAKLRESFRLTLNDAKDPIEQYGYVTVVAEVVGQLSQAPAVVPTTHGNTPWEPLTTASARVWVQEKADSLGVRSLDALAKGMVQEIKDAGLFTRYVDLDIKRKIDERFFDIALNEIRKHNPGLSDEELAKFVSERLKEMPPSVRQPLEQSMWKNLNDNRDIIADNVTRRFETALEMSLNTILGSTPLNDTPNPVAKLWMTLLKAYRDGDVEGFNKNVDELRILLASTSPQGFNENRADFEAYFNHSEPFFYSSLLYLVSFILAVCSWLGWSGPQNRASFWLIVLTGVVHTLALVARMYITDRWFVTVTNLYSSAVFIGWGAVLFGIVFELVFRRGIGNVIASTAGFSTLLIAHFLSLDGDTFTVMQAVLDTNFWLATHVTCITLGYATTFVAGLLGLIYVILGVATPSLSRDLAKDLGRMIYGTLCFAIFFSFVGTVLGGLWADDSWGRFWGWDPKENGALIIVLWNALILHARWGAMVGNRGMAVLAIAGNIVTSWSWFGVNELGIGLHAYGFTEGVLLSLIVFATTQFAVIGVGCLPKEMWRSNIG